MTKDRRRQLGAVLVAGVLASQALAADEDFTGAAVGSYQEPGHLANRDYSSTQQVDSVDPFTGALKMLVRDLLIPGNGGLDIEVLRNYQSVTNDHGPYSNGYRERTPFGTGWDLHFGRLWVSRTYAYLNQADNNRGCQISNRVASNLNPILELPDGSRQVLANGDGQDHAFITKERWIGRCLPRGMNKGDGGLIVISPAGLRYFFDKKGTVSPDQQLLTYFVTRIEDPDGNFLQFDYNIGSNNLYGRHHLLKSIQASDGRSVHFTYQDEAGTRPVLHTIVANGVTIRYSYIDANMGVGARPHYLESVNYPDGTRWSYAYNNANSLAGTVPGRFSMASMTSPMGLRTSYAYEFRQMGPNPAERLNVISRRTLSGIQGATPAEQVWEYQYAKGRAPNNDQTLVKGPLQCIGYEHVGTDTLANGASGVNRGLWRVGALVRKYTAARAGSECGPALRSETYTWTSQDISSQHEMRRYNLLVEDRTRAALLASKVIVQDGTSYSTRYTYDAYGQPLTVAEQGQLARTTTYTYVRPGGQWILGKVASQSISGIPGAITSSYSNSGRLTQQAHFGVTTTYAYTSNGDLASVVDANGRSTRHVGYSRGIPGTTTQPDGGVIRRTVNPTGTLASITDPLGRVTRYGYDSMNRVTAVTMPKGGASNLAISYAFGANGATETLRRANYSRVRQYNGLGQLISQRESGGTAPIVLAATYRADGQQASQSLPGYNQASGSVLSFDYDGLGRRTLLRHADGSSISTSYGSANTQTLRDERGNVTTSTYASFGEPSEKLLTRTAQPGGITTAFGRDNLGRLLSIEQGGLVRRYTYDARGFLASELNPETQTTVYGYDAVGNRTSRKVGAAAADTFGYDAMNRLVRIAHSGSQTFTFNYDLAGRLLSQTSYQGNTWNYAYDAHDLLLSESLVLTSPARTLGFRYSYNALDSLQSITYPSGLVVDYAPDAYGRATRAGAFASAIGYHPDGQLSTLTYGNGRRLAVAVDNRRLRVTERQVGGPDLPMHLRYAYDAASNLTQISDLQNSAYNQTLGYDATDRLTSARGIWGAASFAYNPRGDLTRHALGGRTIDYGYDSQGRLASLGGSMNARLSYDARGNTLSATGQYGYDQASRMTWLCLSPRADCATAPDERYSYDVAGRRVTTTDTKSGLRISVYGRNGQLLREEDASGGVKEYIHIAGQLVAHREQCSDRDSDLDGMPDCFEQRLGLDPADPRDGRSDSDGDGLSNADEYRLGTKLRNADSDNDGMPDGWEFQHKLNPLDPADAHLDANGDGISNLNSYLQGVSPLKSNWPAMVPVMHRTIIGN
ncbi:RHS repeat protein [Metapseudomonas resinovorans]|uniref:Teneurin-like YD-shell domain-containing protein n=1 Tax=Metapseudomonas resinovorans NBRC 106553 TaxID=1245471 RepID=S6AC21_METRE|nr:RHS repeat protein [Pseudomonas resinovorans]BAN46032.1 hypothetical protein PCA10_03000 [Pseudomonas resinovorans NBRC 106553]